VIDATEPELRQIEFVDKDIDCANRVILTNAIFQAFRKQRGLLAIGALNEAPRLIPPRIAEITSGRAFSHSQGHIQTKIRCSMG
jgi:hypothetical protein